MMVNLDGLVNCFRRVAMRDHPRHPNIRMGPSFKFSSEPGVVADTTRSNVIIITYAGGHPHHLVSPEYFLAVGTKYECGHVPRLFFSGVRTVPFSYKNGKTRERLGGRGAGVVRRNAGDARCGRASTQRMSCTICAKFVTASKIVPLVPPAQNMLPSARTATSCTRA